jgi:KDO2-lipid IV(A) lauroyltransferase
VYEEEKNNLTATIFAIDQSPSNANNCHWMTFLNQDTGVLFGTEKFAKEYDQPVLYGRINKEKRGYYSSDFFETVDHPKETQTGELTEMVTRFLEKDIIATPQYWLWSHKRWKHKRPAGK